MECMQDGIPPYIQDSHPYRITSTKCSINTVVSPDDGHTVSRNMQRKEINILRTIVQKLDLFTRLYKAAWSTNLTIQFFK